MLDSIFIFKIFFFIACDFRLKQLILNLGSLPNEKRALCLSGLVLAGNLYFFYQVHDDEEFKDI